LRALDHCRELLSNYGGHAQAVGCSLTEELSSHAGVEILSSRLSEYADSVLTPDDLVPELTIDMVLPVDELSLEVFEEIDQLSPFGHGNPVPVFASERVPVEGRPWVLKQKHLKMRVQSNGAPVDAIWWRQANVAEEIDSDRPFDLAYTLSKDNYLGEEKLLLTIKDIRFGT
jgi:single-stranded-DNA-specific exonuclease